MKRLSEDSKWEASKFAERLAKLMVERNLSASALARTIGVGSSTIMRYLRCVCLPKYSIFIRLLDYFGCSADFILGFKDDFPKREGG